MVADEITKEDAAMWIKELSSEDNANGLAEQALANVVCSVFINFEDYNADTSEISEKEAEQILSEFHGLSEDFEFEISKERSKEEVSE